MLNSVLLPEPLGPMIDTYSPRWTDTVTPRNACTTSSPTRYSRVTSIVRTVNSASVVGEDDWAAAVMTILIRKITAIVAIVAGVAGVVWSMLASVVAAQSRPTPAPVRIEWDASTLRLVERDAGYARMVRLGDRS